MLRDMGNPFEIEDRQEAIGRAFDAADASVTRRQAARDRDATTLEAMERFGGQFVKSLAVTARCADLFQYERLKAALPELWTRYAGENARRVEKKYE